MSFPYNSFPRTSLPSYRSQRPTSSTPGTFKAVRRSLCPIIPSPITAIRILSFELNFFSASKVLSSAFCSYPNARHAPAEVNKAVVPISLRNFLRDDMFNCGFFNCELRNCQHPNLAKCLKQATVYMKQKCLARARHHERYLSNGLHH